MSFPSQEIIDFWFEGLNDSSVLANEREIVGRWFQINANFDMKVRQLFQPTYETYKDIATEHAEAPDDYLALIILFDQFPRNMFRSTAQMYDTDPMSIELAKQMISKKMDNELNYIQRNFIYMPLMHSENLSDQDLMMNCFSRLSQETLNNNLVNHGHYKSTHEVFGQRHRDIVSRFGRFPHRNHILNRQSTSEEIAFLEEPNSSF